MKKVVIYALLFISLLIITKPNVYAKVDGNTLAELRTGLQQLKNKRSENNKKANRTKNQISNAKSEINSSFDAIETGKKQIEEAKNKIADLNQEIELTKHNVVKLLNEYQISQGENVYLDFIFNATSYADLVYRYSVAKQIISYNDEQIDSWENKVKENEELQIELNKKEIELKNSISRLEGTIDSLGNQLEDITEITMDIDEEIDATNKLIKYYEGLGCKENENLDSCVSVRGDTGFSKPLTKGIITSDYGNRIHPISGVKKFHSGIDMGGNKEGTSVYSTANGIVGMIISNKNKKVCGGQQVYIYHTINGKKYTSAYLHLLSINVKVGSTVTSNTVIGTVGGGSKTSSWESCSTGAHLHFTLAEGWYGSTYQSYSTFLAKTFDPKKSLSITNKNIYWYSR